MTTPPTGATPLVRATAEKHGVDLSTVNGTGVGGRIRIADVLDAADQQPGRAARVAGRQAFSAGVARPRLLIEQQSRWAPRTRIGEGIIVGQAPWLELDVFAVNPLANEMSQANSDAYAACRQRNGNPPTLFATGDLPLFTASGIDPQLLLQLPWVIRHAAAVLPPGSEVAHVFEDFSAPDVDSYQGALNYAYNSGIASANEAYDRRFMSWATIDADQLAWEALLGSDQTKSV